jgi:hypoxanthine phosphoribosyltransferase
MSMPNLIPVLEKKKVKKTVTELAHRISKDYENLDLVLIGVLKGAFIFLADLLRCLTIPAEVDFVRLASYGSETASSGKVRLRKEIEIDVKNKDVLIVEDIIDSGLSMATLIDYINSLYPKSIRICALIDKRDRRKFDVDIDYVGVVVEEGFLVGYGLDYAEQYRYLPGVYRLSIDACS